MRRGVRFELALAAGDAAAACEDVLARAARLDGVVDVVWLGERAGSALALCAALAARTSRVRIATGVLPLPLHHPLRVAEDAATVDALSEGRLELGLGLGDDPARVRAFGRHPHERGARVEEAVAVLRSAWADGPLSHRGAFHRFDGLEVHPKPVQPGGPPLWLGARSAGGAERAARLGVGLLTPDSALAARFLDAWTRAGRDPAGARVAVELPWVLRADAPRVALPEPFRARTPQEALRELAALGRGLPAATLDAVLPGVVPGVPADALDRSLALWAEASV